MQDAHGDVIVSYIIKKALACCDEFNLHIKEHCEESRRYIYCSPVDTHYIMRGDKIITSINQSNAAGWIVRKSDEARRVKSLLASDGLSLSDYELCKKSLLETVSPKANIKIYEDFFAIVA